MVLACSLSPSGTGSWPPQTETWLATLAGEVTDCLGRTPGIVQMDGFDHQPSTVCGMNEGMDGRFSEDGGMGGSEDR